MTPTGLWPNSTNAPMYVGCNTTILFRSLGILIFSPLSCLNTLVSDEESDFVSDDFSLVSELLQAAKKNNKHKQKN